MKTKCAIKGFIAILLVFSVVVALTPAIYAQEEDAVQTEAVFVDDFGDDDAPQADYSKIYKRVASTQPGFIGQQLSITNEKPEEYVDENEQMDTWKLQQTPAGAGAYIVYKLPGDIRSFNIQVFRRTDVNPSTVKYYTASYFNDADNSADWTEITVNQSTPTVVQSGFPRVQETSNIPIPEGHRYFKLEYVDNITNWNPRIGQVAVTYEIIQPRVTGGSPANGAQYVTPADSVMIQLDGAVEPQTILPGNFEINQGLSVTAAEYNAQKNQILLRLSGQMEYDKKYVVTISENIKNDIGNPIPVQERSISFLTDLALKADNLKFFAGETEIKGTQDLQTGSAVKLTADMYNRTGETKNAIMLVMLYQGDQLKDIQYQTVQMGAAETQKNVSMNYSVPAGVASGCSLEAVVIDSLLDLHLLAEKKLTGK